MDDVNVAPKVTTGQQHIEWQGISAGAPIEIT